MALIYIRKLSTAFAVQAGLIYNLVRINMDGFLKTSRVHSFLIILSFLFLGASILLLSLKFAGLPPEVPLFYSRPWGEERLAQKVWLWLLPGLSLVFLSTNLILTNILLKKDNFLAQIALVSQTIVLFLLFWTLFKIVFLIG